MNIPELVLFDLGDVTCRFVPDERTKAFASLTGLAGQRIESLIWNSGLSSECDRGLYDRDEMLKAINTTLSIDLDLSTLMEFWSKAFVIDNTVLEIARRVSKKTRIGLFTNNAPILRSAFPVWFPQLENLFDPIVFSYELKVTKPDLLSFQKVQALTGIREDRMMLIDDSAKNVDAAVACGWHAIRFDGSSNLVEALKSYTLL